MGGMSVSTVTAEAILGPNYEKRPAGGRVASEGGVMRLFLIGTGKSCAPIGPRYVPATRTLMNGNPRLSGAV
jgi:hypothetical protein